MPFLGLGLLVAKLPLPSGSGPDGVIQSEAADFLQVEAGQFLAFD